MRDRGYWAFQSRALRESFSELGGRRFMRSVWFDLLAAGSILVIIVLASVALERVSSQVMPDLSTLNMMKMTDDPGYDALFEKAMPNLVNALYQMAAIFILAYIFTVFCLSIFYAHSWSIMQAQKFSFIYARRLFVSGIISYLIWLLMFVLAAILLPTAIASAVTVIILLIFIYCEQAFRALYSEKKKVLATMRQVCYLGFSKAHWFLLYEAIALALCLIVFFALGLAVGIAWLFWLLIIAAFVFMIGFLRIYMIRLMKLLA
jgi:hypothetical protein